MSLDATPSEGALSIEQATGLLSAEAPVETVEQADIEDEASLTPEAETVSEAEEPGDDGEAEQQEPEVPVVDAPHWWTAEEKAEFAKLTPEAQAIVHRQEALRETVVSKAKEEAAAERKRAETEAQTYQSVMGALAQVLPQWQQTFQSRWANVNWAELQQQYSAEDVNAWRFQYEQESQQLQQAQEQHQQATAQAYQKFLAEETAELAKIRPELADPKDGNARKQDLLNYLLEQGAKKNPALIKDLPAWVLNVSWKAQQYDKAQASLAAKPKPIPQKANVQPTAAVSSRTSQQRSVEQLQARLNKSGSIDDAVALLQAQRKTG